MAQLLTYDSIRNYYETVIQNHKATSLPERKNHQLDVWLVLI